MDVYPTLTYTDVAAALSWLEKAFGLRPLVIGGPELQHAAVVHGEGMVLIEAERPGELHGSHAGHGWVYLAVDDVDAHFARAGAAEAEILNEPHDAMDGAQRGYSARDLEGNLWTFGTARPRG